jgi:hypothetical protein
MEMDLAMASAVIPGLPGLDDGTGLYLRSFLGAFAGKR